MNDLQRLQKILNRGKLRFVLIYGILGWGLITAVAFLTWTYFSEYALTLPQVFFALIAFPLGGIAWGSFMWRFTKKRYQTLAELYRV